MNEFAPIEISCVVVVWVILVLSQMRRCDEFKQSQLEVSYS